MILKKKENIPRLCFAIVFKANYFSYEHFMKTLVNNLKILKNLKYVNKIYIFCGLFSNDATYFYLARQI